MAKVPSVILVLVFALAATVGSETPAFAQFTDDPLTAGTPIKAVHITELRTAVANVRASFGLPPFVFSDPTLTPGVTPVRAVHVTELRSALDEAYDAAVKTRPAYTDPALAGIVIKAVHIQELRTAIGNAFNRAPSFTKGADQTVTEDAGAQTVVAWATGISAGPNEGSQTVDFVIDSNDNTGLFSAGPSVAANGTLTYTPAPNQHGVAIITLHIHDNGGTANGGVDTSAAQSFVITVTAINDAPVVSNKTYGPNAVQANMKMIGLTGLLVGVTDADSGVNGCNPTFTVAGVSATTPAGGTVTVTNASTGVFDFDPPPGATGNVTFTYTVQDTGCPGTATSAAATVTVNVAGPVIWFVDSTSPGGGNGTWTGTNAKAFQTVAQAAAVDASDHRVFVLNNSGASINYAGGIALNTGEWLVGQGATGANFDSLMGITPPAGTVTRPSVNGVRPTLQGTVTVNTQSASNVVKLLGFNLSTGAAAGLTNGGTTINGVTVNLGSVATTTGTAVSITGTNNGTTAANAMTFVSVSANGGTNGIALNNATGSFTITGDGGSANNSSGGTIQNTTGDAILLSSVQNISLDQLNIQNTGNSGINGTKVNNFSVTNSTINNSGNAGVESNIAFNTNPATDSNIAGTLTITGNTLTNAFYSGVDIQAGDGTVTNANISNNTLTSTASASTSVGFGINFNGVGSATTRFNLNKATISGNVISNFPSASGIQINGGNANASGTGATIGIPNDVNNLIAITGNTIHGFNATTRMGGSAIIVAVQGANAGSRSQANIDISNNGTSGNPVTNISGTVIGVGANGFVTMTAKTDNNYIVANHQANFGGANGIAGGDGVSGAGAAWTPNLTWTVTNNTISQTDGNGILIVNRATNGTLDLKVAANSVAAPINVGGTARQGIRVDSGNGAAGENTNVCLNIAGNTSAGSNGAAGMGVRKQGGVATTDVFGIHNISPNPPTNVQVQSFINGLNGAGGGTDIISGSNYVRCTSAPN